MGCPACYSQKICRIATAGKSSMDTIVLALNVVIPLLLLMLAGVGARKLNILTDEYIKGLNVFIFRMLLPILMFVNVYQTDVAAVFDFRLIVYTVAVTMTVFLLSFKIVPLFEKDNPRRGALIQSMVRGNGAYFGIPITVALIGEKYTGLMALVVAFAAIFYNLTSVIIFESFRNEKVRYLKIFIGVITNPMILGTVLGLIFVLLNIKIPALLFNTIKDISGITTPLALITLGASFVFTESGQYIKQLTAGVLVKLVIVPAIALPIAIALGFSNHEVCCLFSLLTAPTAVASFAVAQQMGGDGVLAGQLVVFTSLFSMVSIFLWIIILGPHILV